MGVTPHYLLVSSARDADPAFRPRPPPSVATAQFPALAHRGQAPLEQVPPQLDFFIVNVALDGIGKSFAGPPVGGLLVTIG
jgi:hypothetical protein